MMAIGIAVAALGLAACNSEAKDEKAADNASAPESSANDKTAPASEADLKAVEEAITKSLQAVRNDIKIRSIKESAIPGLFEVQILGQGVIYMDKNGEYFVDGKMMRFEGNRVVNVTEEAMTEIRKELMAGVKKEDSIVFAPEGETKASITVFTDVDCGFCQKLHREVPALNDKGIEVRYLAYPRAGLNSPSYKKIASAWCAENPQEALTKVKNREPIPENVCEGNPVAAQYEFGQQLGISGTPAILLDNGELIPGYMPADRLAERIGVN